MNWADDVVSMGTGGNTINPFGSLRDLRGEPIREVVFRTLRQAIISGACKPGDRLIERDLANIMTVSRTPIREALRKLELEGMVKWTPFGGVTVTGISEQDIDEIFSIRKVLEGLSAQVAALKATEEQAQQLLDTVEAVRSAGLESQENRREVGLRFHTRIAEISGYRRLDSLLHSYRDYLEAFRTLSIQIPGRQDAAAAEHRAIAMAIAQRAPDMARRLMEQHIDSSHEGLRISVYQRRQQG